MTMDSPEKSGLADIRQSPSKGRFLKMVLCLAVLLLAVFFGIILGVLVRTNKPTLPAGAVKIQEKNGLALYTYHDAKGYKDWLDTGNSTYLVEGRKVLATIKLHSSEQVALEAVSKNQAILVSYPVVDTEQMLPVREDRVFHTNRAQLYILYRDSGIMEFANFHDDQSGGRLVGAASDDSLLLFSSVGQSEDGHFYAHMYASHPGHWESFEYGFDMPMNDKNDTVDDVSISPDGRHAAVVIEDLTTGGETGHAGLYILDMTRTESPPKKAELSIPTDQMWAAINSLGYSGLGTAFAGSIVGWDSPTAVRVTTSPGQVETFNVQ
jgi:hypothetical protein